MQLKPGVQKALQTLLTIAALVCVVLIGHDYMNVRNAVEELERRPVLIQRVVERPTATPTASPSATIRPVRRVTSPAPTN